MYRYFVVLWAIFLTACDDSNSSSATSLLIPDIKPPVETALPSNLIQSNFSAGLVNVDYTKNCQSDPELGDVCGDFAEREKQFQCVVKNRLFCPGPTEVLTLLDGIDGRLAEIERRSDGKVSCLEDTPTDSTADLTLPGDEEFSHKLNCKDSSIPMAFGNEDDVWYVREGGGEGAGGSVFSVTDTGLVNGYLWLPSRDGSFEFSTGMLRIKADRDASLVEITGGGVGVGLCAFSYISSQSFIYILGNPSGGGGTCDFTGDLSTDEDDWQELCLDTSTMDPTDVESCSDLKSSRTINILGRGTTTSTGGQTEVYEATAPAPSGESVDTFEMNDYLNELDQAAGNYQDSVAEFSVE